MPPVKGRRYQKYKRTSTVTAITPSIRKAFVKIANQAAKRATEIKRQVAQGAYGSILDSSHYVINPLYNISQGTTAVNRIGQEIKLDSVKVKWSLQLQNSTTNCELWVYAFWSDLESITSSTTPTQVTTANILATLPMNGAVTTNMTTIMHLDRFQCTPVRDARSNISPNFSGQAIRYSGTLDLKFKGKKVKYSKDAASYFEGKNLYIGWATSAGGVVDTTVLGNLYQSTLVTFRE